VENKLLRGIKTVLRDGFIYNEMGGLGDAVFTMFFRNASDRRGVVPSRYYKSTNIPSEKVKKLLTNWEDLMLEECPKCGVKSPVVEIEHRQQEANRFYKDIYSLVYCEKCDRVFLKDLRQI